MGKVFFGLPSRNAAIKVHRDLKDFCAATGRDDAKMGIRKARPHLDPKPV